MQTFFVRGVGGLRVLQWLSVWAVIGVSACAPPTPESMADAQGHVLDNDVGLEHQSPLRGRHVCVRGRVTAPLCAVGIYDETYHGFILESTTPDDDETTSDALYVDLGTNTTLFLKGQTVEPAVGDIYTLCGRVQEIGGMTALADPAVLVREQPELTAPIPPVVAPPTDRTEADRYWERREGRRFVIPAGSVAQGGRKETWWGTTTFIYLLLPGDVRLSREDPEEARAFRDAHPLDDQPDVRFDNGNGDIVCLSDRALKAVLGPSAKLPEVMTGEVLRHAVTGVVFQSYGAYLLQPEIMPEFVSAPEAAVIHPSPATEQDGLRIVSYNIENLYDFRDDPFDTRDFYVARTDTNLPRILENYIPESRDAYDERLSLFARQFVEVMSSPDIVLIQEVEDQDLEPLRTTGSVSVIDRYDDRPDALQDLALRIEAVGGPRYQTVYDREGADARGIVCAYMYRPDRVRLADVPPEHPVLGRRVDLLYDGMALGFAGGGRNPRALNAYTDALGPVFSRTPQIACFEWMTAESSRHIYVLNNHFKSVPNEYVDRRIEQARFNGAVAETLQAYDPGAWIVVGGDLNTFPRPDEPIPEEPADQLGGLYRAGLFNVYDRWLSETPAAAYTYVYGGQAQTLDHIFVSSNMLPHMVRADALHINCDYTRSERFPLRAASDHDPVRIVLTP